MKPKRADLQEFLGQIGITFDEYSNAIHRADETGADKVCEAILVNIESRRERESQGETHLVGLGLALADSTINEFIYSALCGFTNARKPVPKSLLELTKTQLAVKDFKYHVSNTLPYWLAAHLVVVRPNASNRKIAKIVCCDHTTVRRWRQSAHFKGLVAVLSSPENIDIWSRFMFVKNPAVALDELD